VPLEVELARTVPVVAALRAEWDGLISIDTTKATVARMALAAGADIINDVSGLRHDPAMTGVCRDSGCGVVVMHLLGTPPTMQHDPRYDDVVAEVTAFFAERLATLSTARIDPGKLLFDSGDGFGKHGGAHASHRGGRHARGLSPRRPAPLGAAGIDPETLGFDPGIGFGKTVEHNLRLLGALDTLTVGRRPLLLGVSRKSFIGRVLGIDEPTARDTATAALTACARRQGVMLHRVHAVRPNLEAIRLVEAIANPIP